MRICLYAGACAGKSTVAKGLAYELGRKGYRIELVGEYIKKWAYEKKVPKSFDQLYIFGKQVNAEDYLLQSGGVDHIVTDSPILMQAFYARKFEFPCWKQLLEIAQVFDATHPALNIFLDREGIPYVQDGRYEDEATARENDANMRLFLDEHVDYVVMKSKDVPGIVEAVEFLLHE